MNINYTLIIQAIALALLLALFFSLYLGLRGYRLRNRDTGERLEQLDKLLRDGRISAEEHARQRATIISRL